MPDILVADDDKELQILLKKALSKDGATVFTAGNGFEVKHMVNERQFDLILLDIMMPGENGLEVCKDIRNVTDCPIIFLTARSSEEDMVRGLGLGGDDYITKPFRLSELRARINAHLRREKREKRRGIKLDNTEFDMLECKISVDGKQVPVTPSEYRIAEFLALNRGRTFSREQIYEKIWGYDSTGDSKTVTEHIRNIRSKLSACGAEDSIKTVWGIGYKWVCKNED
jgi:DNA-binding response OmpR family regulator